MPPCLTCLVALIALLPVAAVGQADASAKRERLDAERSQAEEIYRRKEAECRTRFAVTACIDAARAERRATLARIRDEQLQLDEARRKERAAERLRRIEEKRRESAGAPPPSALPAPAPADSSETADSVGTGGSRRTAPATTSPAATTPAATTPAATRPAASQAGRATPRRNAARPAYTTADRPTPGASASGTPPGRAEGPRRKRQPLDVRVQQRNRAAYEEKQREARERREAAERRQAERERSGKKAAPLPAPAGPLP